MLRMMAVGLTMTLALAGPAAAASKPATTAPTPGAAAKPAATAKPAAAARDSAWQAALREGWPDTRAGERASGWVGAFDTGEAAMKAYLAEAMAPKSLESKNLNQRVESYRSLREKYGKLGLGSVEKSTPEELTVKLMDSSGEQHTFVFTVKPEAPYQLVSVGIKEWSHGHGMFGH